MKRFAHFYRGVCNIHIKKNTIMFFGKQIILLKSKFPFFFTTAIYLIFPLIFFFFF